MENLLRDLQLGLRQLARRRSFTIAALLALTLGVGATSAMLSVVDAVLLHTLPYRDSSRLLVLTGTFTDKGEAADWPISQLDFDDIQRQSRSFSALSVFTSDLACNIGAEQEPERVTGELVSQAYFPLLGLKPAAGRFFTADEDAKPMQDFVVVLSHDLWRRRFGGDPHAVGQLLDMNGRRYRIVGVAPAGFKGLTDQAALWVPSKVPPKPFYLTNRRLRWVSVVGRLQPGVTVGQAQGELDRITAALAQELPDTNRGMGVRATGLRDYWFGDLRRGLLILTLGACLLLLIACINVANLHLTRAIAEQREHAIRLALGADRKRLVRQLVTQSLLLTLLGAALGLLLAHWATPVLIAVSGIQLKSFVHLAAGPRVITAVTGVALLSGVAFGLVPVWITFQTDLTDSLTRPGSPPRRGLGRQVFQSSVVVAQIALAMVLAVGAGLMARDFQRLLHRDLGFRAQRLLTFRVDFRGPQFNADAPVQRLVGDYLDRLAVVPGVEQAEMADPTIPTDPWSGAYFTVEDHASDAPDGTYPMMAHSVSPGYFRALGIPILRGRSFTPQESESYGVIVSKTLADEHWKGQDPLGKRLKNGPRGEASKPWLPVVGVAADVQSQGLQGAKSPGPDVYLPIRQHPWRPLTMSFLVRPKPGVPPYSLLPALRREMKAIAPDLPLYDVATMEERLLRQTDKARFQLVLVSLFTVLALVLAAVGIYGVVAFSVAQRTREVAVRMSLGADRGSILRLVVGRGAALAGIGLAVGVALVLASGPYLSGILTATSATDPWILGGTALVLFLVTLAANYLPARRAASLDPVRGLRTD